VITRVNNADIRWGSIDTNGCLSTSPSLDTIGFFARCIPDLQLLAKVCNIVPMAVPTSLPAIKECRFGFVKTDQYEEHASEDSRQVWGLAKKILSDAGAVVEEITLGPEYDNMGYAYEICDEEVATSLLAHYRLNKADLSQGLRNMVETGGGISHLEAQRHRDHMAALRPKFDAIAQGFAAIITPSCAGEAPKKDEFNAETRFCGLWTALHVPVVNVPGFAGFFGLPIGLSLVGARYAVSHLI
jgi:Asp-tRNA(Asn)/Glu-tRNA(Gln) amidotransferase A subunit family amidase